MNRTIFKKCIALILALLLLGSVLPNAMAEEAPTEESFGLMIQTFREEFPAGKYWNKANGTINSGRYRGSSMVGDRNCIGYGCGAFAVNGTEWAWQCHGYAMMLGDRVFGSFYNIDDENWKRTDYTRGTFSDELYAGDIVRVILPRGTAHSVFVYKVTDEEIYYTECNRTGKCKLDWASEEREAFNDRVRYVLHYEGNMLKGTKTETPQLAITYHANGGSIPGSERQEQRYRVLTDAGMNLREEPSLTAKKVGRLDAGTVFSVSESVEADGYLWGKVDSSSGWCAISEKDWVESFSVAATSYVIDANGLICKSESGTAYYTKRYAGIRYPEGIEDASTFGLEKQGSLFMGWATDPQATTVIDPKQEFLPESLCPDLAEGDQSITLYAIWKDAGSGVPFLDVATDKWYYEGVEYTYQKEWMNGMTETAFVPDGQTTRAMLVTVLYRIEGSPAPAAESEFSDVAAGKWYTDAITWAAENNIVNGMGDGLFAPDDAITRAQMAAIFFRYAQYKQKDEGTRAPLESFADHADLPAWAADGMQWAVSKGIINGVQENTALLLQPNGNATRAQIATVLMRYDKEILN